MGQMESGARGGGPALALITTARYAGVGSNVRTTAVQSVRAFSDRCALCFQPCIPRQRKSAVGELADRYNIAHTISEAQQGGSSQDLWHNSDTGFSTLRSVSYCAILV